MNRSCRMVSVVAVVAAAANLAEAKKPPVRPARVAVELTDIVLAFPADTVGAIDVLDALGAKRDAMERCLNANRVLAFTTGLALMTVDATGTVTRIDVAGLNDNAAPCLSAYRGAKLRTAVAGVFSVKVTVAAAPPPPPPAEVPIVPPGQHLHGSGALPVTVTLAQSLLPEDIDRVFRSRVGLFRACYQKELNRSPALRAGGKLVVTVIVDTNGKVTRVRIDKPFHSAVDACIVRQVYLLKFPTDGVGRTIKYPFLFASGS